MNKTKKDLVVDSIFLISLVVVVIGLIVNICIAGSTEETVEPTTEPTETVRVIYITEPTEEETIAETTEETNPVIYDVPLSVSLQEHIVEQADKHGIDPRIIIAMAFKESTYNEKCIGDGGNSYGLLQVQPRWHYARMQRLGCTDLLDPYQNVTVAVDYLAEQIDRYGDLEKGLTAYNQGHYSGVVSDYAKVVIALAKELVIA